MTKPTGNPRGRPPKLASAPKKAPGRQKRSWSNERRKWPITLALLLEELKLVGRDRMGSLHAAAFVAHWVKGATVTLEEQGAGKYEITLDNRYDIVPADRLELDGEVQAIRRGMNLEAWYGEGDRREVPWMPGVTILSGGQRSSTASFMTGLLVMAAKFALHRYLFPPAGVTFHVWKTELSLCFERLGDTRMVKTLLGGLSNMPAGTERARRIGAAIASTTENHSGGSVLLVDK